MNDEKSEVGFPNEGVKFDIARYHLMESAFATLSALQKGMDSSSPAYVALDVAIELVRKDALENLYRS